MLDRYGFKRQNYAEVKTDMEQRAKELFGENVNLSPKSLIGAIVMLFAWFYAKALELAEKVYHSAHVRDAEGVQLDYLTPNYNTSRQPEQYSTVTLSLTGAPTVTVLEGTRFETETGIDFALTEIVTLDSLGEGIGVAVCLTPGVIGNVAAGSITVQSEPNADITSVNNLSAATGGRDEETDDELRARLLSSGSSTGSGTINAILTDVKAVPGVRAANIDVNNADTTVNGLPPHSYQIYALGGDGQAIAEAIFKNFTGLQAFGTNTYSVLDIAGNTHTIGYTPTSITDIFAAVNITADSTFLSDGIDQVKDAIVRLIGGTATDGTIYTGMSSGEDVIRYQVEKSLNSIEGIIDVTVTIGTAANSLGTTNISIDKNKVAQIDAANILVTVTV